MSEETMLREMVPDYLDVICINGDVILGHLKDHIILDALQNNGDPEEWVLAWNIDMLDIIKLSPAVSYTTRKLRPEEKEIFEQAKTKMLRAKMYSLNYWENEIYNKYLGKNKR